MTAGERLRIAVPLCLVANYVVALWIFQSQWGSVLLMDDTFRTTKVLIPVGAGFVLGLVQVLVSGVPAVLIAAAIGLLGVLTFVLAYTLLCQVVGIALGGLTAYLITQRRPVGDCRKGQRR